MLLVACSAGGKAGESSVPEPTASSDTVKPRIDTLTFALVGDIMMGTTFPETPRGAYLPPNDGKNLFDDCRDIFKRVDIAAGNLEGTLLDGPGKPRPMTNPNTYYLFRMPTHYVANLVDAGIDFVGIATNHINDFGEPGRQSTMETLKGAGMSHAGLKDKCDFVILERKGHKIAITQFGHGDNNLDVTDLELLKTTVKRMREQADIVVVAFHGGAEGVKYAHVPHAPEVYVGEKRGHVDKFAHTAIDAGADLVYGHGPHVPRAWELYDGHLIIYSLGNFCAPYRLGTGGITGIAPLAEVSIDSNGKFIEGQIHSFGQVRGRGPVKHKNGNPAAELISHLTREDFPKTPLTISADGKVMPKP